MDNAFEIGRVVTPEEFRTVHRDYQKGIYVPAGSDTAASIRFKSEENDQWGYTDRWLEVGRRLDYTGQGAAPAHQGWNRFNEGLRKAHEAGSPVHVFEVLPLEPRAYRYCGQMVVSRWYEHFVAEQGRTQLRFILETPD